jgi:hypothetical protein
MQLTRARTGGPGRVSGGCLVSPDGKSLSRSKAAIPLGLYELPRRSGEAHLYRLNHPLAEAIVAQAKSRELPPPRVRFDYGQHDGKVTTLEPLIGKTGWLAFRSSASKRSTRRKTT